MPGPMPKHSSVRQRSNKQSTRTTLSVPDIRTVIVPPLPKLGKGHKWHARTQQHWDRVMQSPMAPEYDTSDFEALYMIAELWDSYYKIPESELPIDKQSRLRIQLMAELRLQEQRFGLTPMDRRRLQWEIDRGEQADQNTRKRRNETVRKVADKDDPDGDDPRLALA